MQYYSLAQPQAPPSETRPYHLAVPPHRQAPQPYHTHYFTDTAWRSTPCRQALRSIGASHVATIAWRISTNHQAPYQRHSVVGFGTQFGWFYNPDCSKVYCVFVFQELILIFHQS